MKRGYVKLWRKSMESSMFSNEKLWKLWCLCLMRACHEEIQVLLPGLIEPVNLSPGQFITGRYSLHEDYHQAHLRGRYSRKAAPTAKTLYRYLETLKKMQFLTIKKTNKYSIITITKWELYQENVHQLSISCPSADHKQEVLYKGDFFSVSEKQHRTYQGAYPSLDLTNEYKKMEAWLTSNPSKRKTKRGYPKFINGWLSKAFDQNNKTDWFKDHKEL